MHSRALFLLISVVGCVFDPPPALDPLLDASSDSDAAEDDASISKIEILTSSAAGELGVPFSLALAASGGTEPYRWEIDPIGGLTLEGAMLSGVPDQTGTFQVEVRATDAEEQTVGAALMLTIHDALAIADVALVPGLEGTPYSASLSATGGPGDQRFDLAEGALPAGLALAEDGTIGGTPSMVGERSFTARARDSLGGEATRAMSLAIDPRLQIETATPADAFQDVPYSTTIGASGGRAPYAWTAIGTLPPGLSLAGSPAVISGTPTLDGTYAFELEVADALDRRARRAFQIEVHPAAPSFITTSLPDGVAGDPYDARVEVRGGTLPLTFIPTLPPGLSLIVDGARTARVNGSPSTAGLQQVEIFVEDASARTATFNTTIEIVDPPPLALATLALPSLVICSDAYQAPIASTGGYGSSRTWTITAGNLPGFRIEGAGATASLRGPIPPSDVARSLSVRVTDEAGASVSRTYALGFTGNGGQRWALSIPTIQSGPSLGFPADAHLTDVCGEAPGRPFRHRTPAGLTFDAPPQSRRHAFTDDGRWLVSCTQSALLVQDLHSARAYSAFTIQSATDCFRVRTSLGSSRVAWLSGGGSPEIYSTDLSQAAPVSLSVPTLASAGIPAANGFELSPDGTRLAFAQEDPNQHALFIANLGTNVTLRADAPPIHPRLSFSPDSRLLLYEKSGSLQMIDVSSWPPAAPIALGNTAVQIAEELTDSFPWMLSHDGSKVAHHDSTSLFVRRIAPLGPAAVRMSGAYQASHLVWSHDDTLLLFAWHVSGASGVALVFEDGSAPLELLPAGQTSPVSNVGTLAFSLDDRWAAFCSHTVNGDCRLQIVDLDDPSSPTRYELDAGPVQDFRFAPTSNRIAWRHTGGQLSVAQLIPNQAPVASSVETQVTLSHAELAWTSDGRRLLYATAEKIGWMRDVSIMPFAPRLRITHQEPGLAPVGAIFYPPPEKSAAGGAIVAEVAPLPGTTGAGADPEWALWPMPPDVSGAGYDISSDTVLDSTTQLTWQRSLDPAIFASQADASDYCTNLSLGPYTDWRLPTRIELISLMDLQSFELDATAFPGAPNGGLWTSTPHPFGDFWVVALGHPSNPLPASARCVRADPVPDTPRVTIVDEHEIHNFTGLIWTTTFANIGVNQSRTAAIQYCENLTVDGFTDWRLPTAKELLTYIDSRVMASRGFWTDTRVIGEIVVRNGELEEVLTNSAAVRTRCVR